MLFTDDELASYPGAEGITPETTQLLRRLAQARIYALVPPEIADTSDVAAGIGMEVVARAYRNSEGYATESIDDWTGRRGSVAGLPGVYLTDQERADLLRLLPETSRSSVRSVRLRSWSQR